MEQLSRQKIDLSHSTVMEAASTQINMAEEGNGTEIISALTLSTVPNALVRCDVVSKMENEISLITHDFNRLTTSAKEISEMI